jgi:hypothetical protein
MLDAQVDGGQVHGQHSVPVVVVVVGEDPSGAEDAGVVVGAIEAPERSEGVVDHGRHLRPNGHISPEER